MSANDVGPSSRLRRSAGNTSAAEVIGRGFQGSSKDMTDADIQAVDEGVTLWLACSFRGTYGEYPRKFSQKLLYLTPDGMLFKPVWYSLSRKVFRISEEVVSTHKRRYNFATDWNIKAKGRYGVNGQFSYAGFEFIVCHTSQGVIEVAVPRPDVPLLLYYISRKIAT